MTKKPLWLIPAAMLLSACATGRFKEPVTVFDKAVATTVATTKLYQQQQLERFSSVDRVARNGEAVCLTSGCTNGQSECLLKAIPAARKGSVASCEGTELKLATPMDDSDKKVVAAVELLGAYAQGLGKLATADSADDLDKAITGLQKSLASLGEATEKVTELKTNVAPFAAIVNFIGGTYLEWRRERAISQAIEAADPAVQQVPRMVGTLVKDSHRAAVLEAGRLAFLAQAEYAAVPKNATRSEKRVEALKLTAQRTEALNKLIKADTQGVFNKMARAHTELVATARDSSVDLSFDAIKDFAESAKDTYAAIEKIR